MDLRPCKIFPGIDTSLDKVMDVSQYSHIRKKEPLSGIK